MAKVAQFTAEIERHRVIGVDSSIFIYQFEQHSQFASFCHTIFDRLDDGVVELATSTVTVSEVLVRPLEQKDPEVVMLYEQVFTQLPRLRIIAIDYRLAKLAAQLRVRYHIFLPDAYQIAAALTQRATLFVTNDRALKKVNDLKVICLHDYL